MNAGVGYMARSFVPSGMRGPRVPLAGLGDFLPGSSVLLPYLTDPCNAPAFYLDKEAWTACQAANEVAQIQTVPQNARTYYGPNSVTAQVAQQAADQQSGFASADAGNVADYFGAGQALYDPQNKTALPTWAWVAIAAAAAYAALKLL